MPDNVTSKFSNAKKELLITALIFSAVLVSYYNALYVGFVSDDFPQIVNNPDIKNLSNLFSFFTKGVWHTDEYTGGFYRPLAFATWMFEYALAGAKPFLYHADNIILHFLCSLTIYHVVKRLDSSPLTPLFTALVFAVHPVHAEAVTWIACRMELMYSLFVLLALWVFIARPRTPGYIALSCLLFMAGLLSKEAAIVLPLLILGYLLLYETENGRTPRFKRVIMLILPYAATASVYIAVRLSVMGLVDQGITYIYTNYDKIGAYKLFLTMCQAFYEYARLCVLPFDQRLEYVFRPPDGIFTPKVVITLASAAALLIFSRRLIRGSRTAFYALLWFVVCLLPVSNIIPAGIIMTERAVYLSSLGPCLLFGLALSRVDGRVAWGSVFKYFILAAILSVLALGTHQRNKVWANIDHATIIRMMEKRVDAFPGNPVNYGLLAQAYFDAGEYGKQAEDAIVKGLSLDPYDDTLQFQYARLLYKQSRLNESLTSAMKALSIKPDPKYYDFAGNTLEKLGKYSEAAAMFDNAIRMAPDASGYYVDKGNLLVETGEDDKALEMFAKALELDPANKDAYLGTGIVLDSRGEIEKAIGYLRKATEFDPKSPDLHFFLANEYLRAGDKASATEQLKEVLRLKPDYPGAADLLRSIG